LHTLLLLLYTPYYKNTEERKIYRKVALFYIQELRLKRVNYRAKSMSPAATMMLALIAHRMKPRRSSLSSSNVANVFDATTNADKKVKRIW